MTTTKTSAAPAFLNVKAAARILGLPVRTVQYHIKKGTLPATKIGEGLTSSYVLLPADVEKYRAEHPVKTHPTRCVTVLQSE